jgi:hypothetical protein
MIESEPKTDSEEKPAIMYPAMESLSPLLQGVLLAKGRKLPGERPSDPLLQVWEGHDPGQFSGERHHFQSGDAARFNTG